MIVVADRAEDVRGYAEQVAPLADASVIAAVSYSAAPLVEPYVNAEILGGPPALLGASPPGFAPLQATSAQTR